MLPFLEGFASSSTDTLKDTTGTTWSNGGFQMVNFIMTELKDHIPVINFIALIAGNFSCKKIL